MRTALCRFNRTGECAYGENCTYAHTKCHHKEQCTNHNCPFGHNGTWKFAEKRINPAGWKCNLADFQKQFPGGYRVLWENAPLVKCAVVAEKEEKGGGEKKVRTPTTLCHIDVPPKEVHHRDKDLADDGKTWQELARDLFDLLDEDNDNLLTFAEFCRLDRQRITKHEFDILCICGECPRGMNFETFRFQYRNGVFDVLNDLEAFRRQTKDE